MKKDLPKIFKNNVDSRVSHNQNMYYEKNIGSSDQNKKEDRNSTFTVEDKIQKLFKSSRYIFNINVLIKTDKKDYDTRIAGKVKNSLVTVEGEAIPIVEINDIIIKDRI